jgi:hypothetical protein
MQTNFYYDIAWVLMERIIAISQEKIFTTQLCSLIPCNLWHDHERDLITILSRYYGTIKIVPLAMVMFWPKSWVVAKALCY